MTRFLSLVTFCLFVTFVKSQTDSIPAFSFPFVGVHFGGDIPAADMAKRYGPNLNTGVLFGYKTSKNYLFNIDFNFMFGRNIKDDITRQLKTDQNFIIDNLGFPADIRISQRVFNLHLSAGKILPFLKPNANSGFFVNVGAGYMQHKIHIVDAQQMIAAYNGDIRDGFDRLSNGIALSQFLGYMYFSNNRFMNFYAGVEFYQGFTKSVRKFNYDTGMPDTQKRLDILSGLRLGWILPLYKKSPREFYYF